MKFTVKESQCNIKLYLVFALLCIYYDLKMIIINRNTRLYHNSSSSMNLIRWQVSVPLIGMLENHTYTLKNGNTVDQLASSK